MNKQGNDYYAKRLEAVINTALDGIITINVSGRIESANPAALKLFGYSTEELIGENIRMLMPEPDRSRHDGYMQRYMDTGEKRIIGIGREVMGRRKNGEQFPFQLSVSEVQLGQKKIFTGIIHDLSEVNRAQEEIIRINSTLEEKVEERTNELESVVNQLLTANRQLEEKEEKLRQSLEKEKELNDLKSRFVSTASHEFRTPLSTILSSAALIEKYPDAEQQGKRMRHTQRIQDSVKHLTFILNDFLSISKLEEGGLEVNLDEHSLDFLLQKVKEQVSDLHEEQKEIRLTVKTKNSTIVTDGQILSNILINLLSNAVKYCPKGRIEVSVEESDENWTFSVKDEGMGIPASEQKHLFKRFFRASNATHIQGTGLGLNIVAQYVKQLEGKIYFTSRENVETQFFVELPKKKL
ncbi:MAG: PAS domain S-box protein [Bacteroidetes bacterium]|jgi:PAS domain S-box-containing protein|nr:PAS domain S-box protein [Bacteroidota bacterium]